MNETLIEWVMTTSPATGVAYRVHLILATIADDVGLIREPQVELAAYTRCDPGTFRRAVQWLRDEELLTVVEQPRRGSPALLSMATPDLPPLAEPESDHVSIPKYVTTAKANRGCEECGYSEDPRFLHFHHRDPALKRFNLAEANRYTLDEVDAEIEKCDVLCASCHRELHRALKKRPPRRGARRTPNGRAPDTPTPDDALLTELDLEDQDNAAAPRRRRSPREPREFEAEAREIVGRVWTERAVAPAQPFVAIVKIVEALLAVGWPGPDVERACIAVPTISTRWVEAWLNESRGTSSGPRARIDDDREKPTGRVNL